MFVSTNWLIFLLLTFFLHPSSEVAAKFQGGEITFAEYYQYLTLKFGRKAEGQAALDHLVKKIIIEKEAAKRNVKIHPKIVDSKLDEISTQLQQNGLSLEQTLQTKQLTFQEFRHLIEFSLLQEELARQDLHLDKEGSISSEQMEQWLAEQQAKAAVIQSITEENSTVFASVNGETISHAELGQTLRSFVGLENCRQAVEELIFSRLINFKGQELAISITNYDIDAEIDRRRELFSQKEKFKGIGFEEILQTQGLTLQDLRSNPVFLARIMLGKVINQLYPEEELQKIYEQNRQLYQDKYGEKRNVSLLLLRSADKGTMDNLRTHEEAVTFLEDLKNKIKTAEEFTAQAKIYSEHSSKSQGGSLGTVSRYDLYKEPEASAAVFSAQPSTLLGPIKVSDGRALLFVHEMIPPLTEKDILAKIREEKSNEYFNQLKESAKISTFLDQ